jgi:uncharacterized protein (TIGR02246 family)
VETGPNACFSRRGEAPSAQSDVEAIRALIEEGRLAHLREDAGAIADQQADDLDFISRGRIDTRTRQQTRERFAGYFEGVDFVDALWLAEPTVRLLAGGQAAYSLVAMRIVYTSQESADSKSRARYHDFAWSTVWEKRDGRWLRVEMTSTDGDEGDWPKE